MISKNKIKEAVNILNQGGLVAFPTETVYGLGGDANNERAIKQIFLAKERPFSHPLIVHLARLEQMVDWAEGIPEAALRLAQTYWPGPLTIVLKKKTGVLDILTGNQDTVGLRVPRHPVAQALLQAFDRGIAAPSANKFTHVSPTTVDAVLEELGDRVDLILDGGACNVGLESAIIDLSGREPILLRPGMITVQELEHILQMPVYYTSQASKIRAPGMHHLHYAPATPIKVINTQAILDAVTYSRLEHKRVVFLLHSDWQIENNTRIKIVRMPAAAEEYAQILYRMLRDIDHKHYEQIFIEAVPQEEEWAAIRDRIKKASATAI